MKYLNTSIMSNVNAKDEIALDDGSGIAELDNSFYNGAGHLTSLYGSELKDKRCFI